ncbi:predicted protein [Naegleria gruberi]|uniref:Predicted protein n=1 Tax=Naegleria gruberi TaxID=5762 RepID=D2V7T9_NAEGR|nr:uncharacterized protein NAEGRDRAFT_64921 [Naegleria gruberi]EFC46929.1 predicted protein [Naegleria gruberi]|eukprot:XP_002679673.1 predicted protein [Naegleria gruberi strain NEG-M]
MRLIITLLIILLLTACSILTWLASFIGSITALEELSQNLVSRVGEKAITYIDSQLDPVVKLSSSFAADITNGSISLQPSISNLYQKATIYKASSVGVFYSQSLYSVVWAGVYPNEVLTYSEAIPGLVYWKLDASNGNVVSVFKNTSTIPFSITSQAFWAGSFALFNSTGAETILGAPYVVINSGVVIYCSTKIYDPVLMVQGTKKVIGIAKVNLTLKTVQDFLQKLSVIGNGYIILSETNNNVIGASINSTATDGVSRISLFDLTDKNAGQLMTDLKNQYGDMSKVPSYSQITSKGVEYFVSKMDYQYLNVRWNLYMVIYKSDIQRVTNINTGISVAVAVVVIGVGIICGVFIGHIVTKPLRFLEDQFSKIKTFDLNSCNFISSQFKEVDRIYEHLYDMVTWLNEFKSFLPESVFNQLKHMELVEDSKQHSATIRQSVHDSQAMMSSAQLSSKHSGKSSNLQSGLGGITSGGLFKVGLSTNKVTIVCVKLFGFSNENSMHDLSLLFSKIASCLSNLSKTMQVTDMKINSVDEFQLCFTNDKKKKSEFLALDASLKIAKALNNITGKSGQKIDYSIGVCSDLANIGNLGTSSLRYFSIVGSVVDNAKIIALLGHSSASRVLVDGNTLTNVKEQFVYKPVDRLEMELHSKKTICSIFEVIRENVVNQDEWLYELDQSNSNNKYLELQSIFHQLFESSSSISFETLNDFRSKLSQFMNEHPQESSNMTKTLEFLEMVLQCSSESQSHEMLNNYKTVLEKHLTTLSKYTYSDSDVIVTKIKID